MKSNKYKATVTLGVVSLGFLASYPFSGSFVGGLITSGCEAAMVGGLADWFAVTALFKKPLGIPYRTALIPRNRERIFNSLSAMVKDELLTKDNMKKSLDAYDIPMAVLDFMEHNSGKAMAVELAEKIIKDLIDRADSAEIGEVLGGILNEKIQETDITPLMAAGAEWLIKNGYDDRIIDFIINQLIILAGHSRIKDLLTELFLETLEAYERGLNRRIIFNQLLSFSPVQIAEAVQQELISQLDKAKNKDNALRKKTKGWLADVIVQLKQDGELKQKIETWKLEQLERAEIPRVITSFMQNLISELTTNGSELEKSLVLAINRHVDKLEADFAEDENQRKKFDKMVKRVIGNWVDVYHCEIGNMVRSSLDRLSNEMLVDFIEDKVGNDLQMIRINGSVVGGMAGMAIYLLTFWL